MSSRTRRAPADAPHQVAPPLPHRPLSTLPGAPQVIETPCSKPARASLQLIFCSRGMEGGSAAGKKELVLVAHRRRGTASSNPVLGEGLTSRKGGGAGIGVPVQGNGKLRQRKGGHAWSHLVLGEGGFTEAVGWCPACVMLSAAASAAEVPSSSTNQVCSEGDPGHLVPKQWKRDWGRARPTPQLAAARAAHPRGGLCATPEQPYH